MSSRLNVTSIVDNSIINTEGVNAEKGQDNGDIASNTQTSSLGDGAVADDKATIHPLITKPTDGGSFRE